MCGAAGKGWKLAIFSSISTYHQHPHYPNTHSAKSSLAIERDFIAAELTVGELMV